MTEAGARRYGFVIEDLKPTRLWLEDTLRRAFPGIEVASADSLARARALLADRLPPADTGAAGGPHLALVDLGLPDGSGIDLIRDLAESRPDVMTIVTTIYDDDGHLFDAIAAGAQGYLLKDQDAGLLMQYLHRIEQGDPPLSPSIARRMLARLRQPDGHGHVPAPHVPTTPETVLTPREVEVLSLLGRGLRNAEVARLLSLSDHTIAGYVKAIYAKLNICSRAEAALEASRRGLV
ncbi:response regulator transcription factor [Tistrella sp. BH-R2-4]|uniref:Response regulator transcription factor n=1 Tax=Tistrella arctica TaxID=3133430 RepID=A0ABU9YNL6_9PROT